MYCSCTWLCPLYFPSGESTSKPGLLAHVIFEGVARPAKLNSIGSSYSRDTTLTGVTRIQCKSEDRCGAFLRVAHRNAKSSSTSTYVPELNFRGRTRGVTSERMIHSSRPEKSDFSWVIARKRQVVTAVDRYVKIVHAPRNNPLQTRGVITRRPRYRPQTGLRAV